MTVLCFFLGLMVGGTLGVVVMCCFQLGKESERHIDQEKQKKRKE